VKNASIVMLVMALAATSASAAVLTEKSQISQFTHNRVDIPIYTLGEIHSQETDLDAFAVEVSQSLNAYTAETVFEACSNICRAPDGTLAAKIITVEAHAFCPATNVCPSDTVMTGVDIHSHIQVTEYLPNPIDKATLRQDYGRHQKVHTELGFSDGDFSSGKGYMSDAVGVHYQDGPRKVRLVKALP
jgi:hypothetical protein